MSVAEALNYTSETFTKPSNPLQQVEIDNNNNGSLENGASSLSQSKDDNMMTGAGLQRDFRLKGYTSQNMFSPRLPMTVGFEEGPRHEPQVANYYGKPSIFDPAKPRIDDSMMGMMYGNREYDRGHPHPPPPGPPAPPQQPLQQLSQRGNQHAVMDQDFDKIRRQREEMEDDIKRMKEQRMRERMDKEEDKRKNMEMMSKSFPWDRQNQGHGAPRGSGNNRRRKFLETDFSPRTQPGYKDKRETDLFLDVLGGADGKQLRGRDGSPKLADPRFERQQNDFKPHFNSQYGVNVDPRDMQEQRRRIDNLRNQIEEIKANSPSFGKATDGGFGRQSYQNDSFSPTRLPEQGHRRSLDLENTRGGAGAPIKDDRGRNVTRRPITLIRNDYGDSKIKEEIPGKSNFSSFLQEDTRPYNPWGGQGGGAPIRDREGKVCTQTFGNFEGRRGGSGELRRNRRRQEVLYNELREVAKQQHETKELETRYIKAPHGELADVMMQGRVGKPRRNEITGEIEQHHLPNSDVSLVKMNHQPKPNNQKKQYHDELVQAAEERQYSKQLEKLKEKQESNAHFNYMDGIWGNLGGGAPKDEVVRKKANLFNSIHYPDDPSPDVKSHTDLEAVAPPTGLGSFERTPNLSYQKLYLNNDERQFPSPSNSPRYVKATVNSSHKNMFDAPDDPRKLNPPRGGGRPEIAPYATGGVY